jgi:hypothetical protein
MLDFSWECLFKIFFSNIYPNTGAKGKEHHRDGNPQQCSYHHIVTMEPRIQLSRGKGARDCTFDILIIIIIIIIIISGTIF